MEIDTISGLEFPLFIEFAHDQVDHDCCAHKEKADIQKAVHKRDIGDAGLDLTHHELVGNGGQNSNE